MQKLAFESGPRPGPYWSLRAVVTVIHRNTEWWEDCGSESATVELGPPVVEHIAVTYTWNTVTGAFVLDSDAFDELYKRNEARF